MSWGGTRAGAGRPAKGPIASEPHKTRPLLAAHHPVHVTARLLATKLERHRARTHRALRRALSLSLARADFRIVHLALLRDRLELVVEADDKLALARGMQGFQVSAAKALNRLARRRGAVFPDRYRMRILRTRLAVRDTVGRLPLARTPLTRTPLTRTPLAGTPLAGMAWPQTWLLRIELRRRTVATIARSDANARGAAPRRSIRTRADEDS